jgi:two-component system sensor histidine kinase/response regulator
VHRSTQKKAIVDNFVRFDELAAEGHGLGLSIVKRIAEKLGGSAGVERSYDCGSVF